MNSVGIAELKAQLSEYLARVKAGEELLITERGRPIARIQPLRHADDWDAQTLDQARRGILRLPAKSLDVAAFLALPRAVDADGAVLRELLAERAQEDWR